MGKEVFVPDADGKVYPIGRGGGAPAPVVVSIVNNSRAEVQGDAQRGSNGDIQIQLRDAVRGIINNDLGQGVGIARTFKSFAAGGSFRGT